MDQRQPGTPAVLAFAPTQKSQDNSGLIDQVGHAPGSREYLERERRPSHATA